MHMKGLNGRIIPCNVCIWGAYLFQSSTSEKGRMYESAMMTGTQPACSTSLRAAWPSRAPRSTTQNDDSYSTITQNSTEFQRVSLYALLSVAWGPKWSPGCQYFWSPEQIWDKMVLTGPRVRKMSIINSVYLGFCDLFHFTWP